MSYEYDENNGLQPKPPKKNNNDLGSWIFIAVMFAVAWPVGLILLLSKLSEGGGRKMRQQARDAWQRTAAGSAEAKPAQARASAAKNTVHKVTETPNYSDKGAKTMKIIGAAVAILGAFFLVQQVDYFELRYAIKWHEWMDLLRQVFYPMGMMAGGVSLLLGSGAITHGGQIDPNTLRISPTILTDVDWDSPVMQEEIFGPILPILTYRNLDEAIQRIRQRPRPLALYLFTRDKAVEDKVLGSVSFGGGCVNDTVLHLATCHMPFGGVGESGMGGYHGPWSFRTFSHEKSILKRWAKPDIALRYAPFRGKMGKLKKLI